jgi:hypothetical protein
MYIKFVREILKENISRDGRISMNLDTSGTLQGQVTESCKCGNKLMLHNRWGVS